MLSMQNLNFKFDILSFYETWVNEDIPTNELTNKKKR